MNVISDLLAVFDAYRAATGFSESTVSRKFLGAGGRIGPLRAGGDMGTRTIERALTQFSQEWPEGAEWPASAPRPAPVEEAA